MLFHCKQQVCANPCFRCGSETVELREKCVLNFKNNRKYSNIKGLVVIFLFCFYQLLPLRLLSSQKTEKSVLVNQWNCLPKW